jgi:hypothetical protein
MAQIAPAGIAMRRTESFWIVLALLLIPNGLARALDTRPVLAEGGFQRRVDQDLAPRDGTTPLSGRGGAAPRAGPAGATAAADAPPAARLRAAGAHHDIVVWTPRLNASQCTSASASPCYNVYAVNATTGELLWFAYT